MDAKTGGHAARARSSGGGKTVRVLVELCHRKLFEAELTMAAALTEHDATALALAFDQAPSEIRKALATLKKPIVAGLEGHPETTDMFMACLD